MLHFLTNHKFDLLSYFYIINFLNLPPHALIHDLQKKNLQASTRTHDPFFDNSEIWPTFIYRGEVPPDTFAKLPVRDLINDPKKNWYRHQLQPMLHFLTNHKFDLLSYFYIINFLNLPLRALIHDLQKKNLRASTRTHDPFFDNSEIWPTFIYRGEVPPDTFAKLPVRILINDPKKNWYRHQLQPMLHFLTNHKFDLLSYFYIKSRSNLWFVKKWSMGCSWCLYQFFLGSLIRSRTGSFANVSGGTSPLYIKVGQISELSKNGSWVLVDACRFFFCRSWIRAWGGRFKKLMM